MKIGQKLLLGAATLTLVPLALTAGLLWQGANEMATEDIVEHTHTQLTALRDIKAQQVRDELDTRLSALKVLARTPSTIEAMKGFKGSFYNAAKELPGASTDVQRQALARYVETQFNPEFARRNPGKAPDLSEVLKSLDPNAVALQNQFIAENPNVLGEKQKLVAAPSNFAYNRVHAAAHPGLQQAQKLLGFYDIFLIDTETDQVVYTVFKELDFGSRLDAGIAAKSRLAQAYAQMKNARSRDDLYLSDFEPYLPSYNDQAAFAAVPLFDGDRQVGVLAMQYPIDKITATLNSGRTWGQIGLGRTGDAYLVGPDKLMRTDARDVLVSREDFLTAMGTRLSAEARSMINHKKSSVGLVNAASPAVDEALSGRNDVSRFVDYRGVPMLGAYGPLNFNGLRWGIVVNLAQEESDAHLVALKHSTFVRTVVVAAAVLVIVGGLMFYFTRRFTRPIRQLHDVVKAVSQGQTDARSRLVEHDEVGELGRAFDTLLDERIAQFQKAQEENERLNNSVITLLQTVFALSNKDLTARAEVTEDVIGTLSSSINQLSDETGRTLWQVREIADAVRLASEAVNTQAAQVDSTAQGERQALEHMATNLQRANRQMTQVTQLSDSSSKTAEQASSATQNAMRSVMATVRGMDQLRDAISETEKRFKRLGERSQEISSVVSLINSISERTHVLALNASMQAATAGEAGRGFAVVAEEVQRLSESSRQSTQQISQLVQNIQLETNETIYTMNRLISQVVSQSEQAQDAGEQMSQAQQITAKLVQLVQQIAEFSHQQALMSRELQLSVTKLNRGSEATVQAISHQTQSTESLVASAHRLIGAVSQFTLPKLAA